MSTTKRGRGSAAGQRQRQQNIRDYVSAAGSRTVGEIAEHTGVSTMTVYRDLGELESQGLLRLSKGVVTAAASNLHEAASRYRLTQAVPEKEALALAALDLVEPGSAIMMDDSSTGVFLAKLLSQKVPLTLVTNYFPVAEQVKEQRDIRLLMTSGEYLVWADALVGPMAVHSIRRVHADAVFMSASAIINGVVFHPTAEPAEVKRAMLASAKKRVLYVDNSKFSRTALHMVAPVSEFDVVIVDEMVSPENIKLLMDRGTRVIRTRSRRRNNTTHTTPQELRRRTG